MEPLRQVIVLTAAPLDLSPHPLPRLIGLILPRHKPPAHAANAVLSKERITVKHLATEDARQPLRVDHRTPVKRLEPFHEFDLACERTIRVVADDVRTRARNFLRLVLVIGSAVGTAPKIRRERLLRINPPPQFKELFQVRRGDRSAPVVPRLVPEVPKGDAVVIAILHQQLLAHLEELRVKLGIIKRRVTDRPRKRSVLRELPSPVVTPVAGLRPRSRQLPQLLRTRAIIAEHDDGADSVSLHDREHALEPRHETVMIVIPHAKALLFDQDAQRVEADRRRQRQFAIHLLEPFFAAQLLPLVHAVRRTRGHVVATAHPRLGVVPRPRLLLWPRPRPLSKRTRSNAKHAQSNDQASRFHRTPRALIAIGAISRSGVYPCD